MTRTFLDAGVLIAATRGSGSSYRRAMDVLDDERRFCPDQGFLVEASRLASRFGLSAMDALHVAAATLAGADELVTSEKAGRPMHRVAGLTVATIHS